MRVSATGRDDPPEALCLRRTQRASGQLSEPLRPPRKGGHAEHPATVRECEDSGSVSMAYALSMGTAGRPVSSANRSGVANSVTRRSIHAWLYRCRLRLLMYSA